MVEASMSHVYALLALIPVLMLFLSAGIAWGVTTATVKALKNTIVDVATDAGHIAEDLNNWKIQRTNAVVTFPDCTSIRRECAAEHADRVDKLAEKFDKYMEKSDERWEELLKCIAKGGSLNAGKTGS